MWASCVHEIEFFNEVERIMVAQWRLNALKFVGGRPSFFDLLINSVCSRALMTWVLLGLLKSLNQGKPLIAFFIGVRDAQKNQWPKWSLLLVPSETWKSIFWLIGIRVLTVSKHRSFFSGPISSSLVSAVIPNIASKSVTSRTFPAISSKSSMPSAVVSSFSNTSNILVHIRFSLKLNTCCSEMNSVCQNLSDPYGVLSPLLEDTQHTSCVLVSWNPRKILSMLVDPDFVVSQHSRLSILVKSRIAFKSMLC